MRIHPQKEERLSMETAHLVVATETPLNKRRLSNDQIEHGIRHRMYNVTTTPLLKKPRLQNNKNIGKEVIMLLFFLNSTAIVEVEQITADTGNTLEGRRSF